MKMHTPVNYLIVKSYRCIVSGKKSKVNKSNRITVIIQLLLGNTDNRIVTVICNELFKFLKLLNSGLHKKIKEKY